MHKAALNVIVAIVALTFCAHAAVAGPLPGDDAAMAGWQGSQLFEQIVAVPGAPRLTANVEYAVYAPGAFAGSTDLGNPADPSDGTQYVFAYQVFSEQVGNRPVEQLSVGFLDLPPEGDGIDDDEQPQNIGFVDGFASPDADPVAAFNQPGLVIEAANWQFPSGLQPGTVDRSDILIYTSPFGPEWDRGSVVGGGLGNSQRLPSPVPEPTVIGLALLAGACLLLCQRVRRRS
jgi:hypothetical protein